VREISLNCGLTDFLGEFIANRNLFIESGSTYAYMSLAINGYLNDRGQNGWHRRTVCTNNILVFMVMVFQPSCRARLYPGTPAGKYGASYGTGYNIVDDRPEFNGIDRSEMEHFLEGQAQQTIAEGAEGLKSDDRRFGIEVALLAASKLHLKFGPHTGSNENICFKKALLQYCKDRRIPVLLFIDSSKIEFVGTEVAENCRMLYSKDDTSPYSPTDVAAVGESKSETGFDEFAADIAEGHLFLFVGYNKASEKPAEISALEEAFNEFNARAARRNGAALVTHKREQSQKIDMMVVCSESPRREMNNRPALSDEIQRAIRTSVISDGKFSATNDHANSFAGLQAAPNTA
jgi:hypothetical protein